MSSWDKHLKYEEWVKKFENEIRRLKKEKEYADFKNVKKPRTELHLAYNSILLTQLMNGSRISETIEALLKFAADKKHEHCQYTGAKKRRRNKKDRIIIIPNIVTSNFISYIKDRSVKQIQNGVMLFAMNRWKINTHSLRYAFVSYQNRKGTPASVTAGIMRHTNVGMIEHYSRDEEADELFKEMMKNGVNKK